MNGKKSKFDFGYFTDGTFCVNSDMFTEDEAKEIYKSECCVEHDDYNIHKAFVRHRFGVDEDGETRCCWWLEEINPKDLRRFVPVYVFEKY